MRTLKRPMFRMGGNTDQGIMSGVAPRKRYEHGGSHLESPELIENYLKNKKGAVLDDTQLSDWLSTATLGDIDKFVKRRSYQPRGTNVYDFLTEFGLNIASTPPQGNIISTAAASAKEPYSKFLKGKSEADLQRYASESDLFKTLVGAQAKIATGAAESGAGVKEGYSQRIREGLDKIWALKDQLDAGEIEQKDYDRQRNRIVQGLGPYMKDNPEIERLFEVPDYAEDTYDEHREKFLTEELMEDPLNPGTEITQREYYSRRENKAELRRRATDSYMQEFEDRRLGIYTSKAKGGRVKYANAGPVMGQAMPDETMPEELNNLSYDELRSRLPQEVTNDIVQLLANSAEALEDFATIQTEQDIANFNKKYGVNLVLPSEG
jgi:hypothetical protein